MKRKNMSTLLKRNLITLKSIAISALLTSAPIMAYAQTTSNPEDASAKQRDWNITLGIGAVVTPDYFGSKKMEVQPFPLIDISYKNRFFISTLKGAGVYIINDEDSGLSVSASVTPNMSRDEQYLEPRLRGLGKIKMAPQARLSASYTFLDYLTFETSIGKDFGGTKGFQATAGLNANIPVNEQLLISAGVSTRYLDLKTAQGLFGVTPVQSINTGFAVFTPKAGLDSVTLSLTAKYALSRHISMIALVSAEQRLGSSKRSPIIERKTDPSAGIGISYTF
jgi:MipA family protein